MNFKQTPYGFEFNDGKVLVFFGNKTCSIEKLNFNYPEFNIRQVHQKHTDKIIKSNDDSAAVLADAHWTQEKNVALLIKTADCMPILIHQPESHTIAAVHAGWRGVQNRITPKTFEILSEINGKNSVNNFSDVFIGPHISQNSFEVQNDVKNFLLQQSGPVSNEGFSEALYVKNENGKIFVDLEKIVADQISPFKVRMIKSTNLDTKTNPDFHSFRRDGPHSGRNLSFICLLT